uniref:Uncharacterized protein n=1 Tax=Megaselia scalaris TaxID=36166 RepID=T1GJ23_MEGSC
MPTKKNDFFYEQLDKAYDLILGWLWAFNSKVGKDDIYKGTIGMPSLHNTTNDNVSLSFPISKDDSRKTITEREEKIAGNLMTYWEFEGYLKYSPLFYGYGQQDLIQVSKPSRPMKGTHPIKGSHIPRIYVSPIP